MTSLKATKRALLTSVLALCLCFTMLLGTTYAWFTDSATSANNKIVAGRLDVQLFQWTDANTRKDISQNGDPVFTSATVWEPGRTEVVYLSIKNNGTLALKYRVVLDVTDVSMDSLTDVMRYAIQNNAHYGDVTSWVGNANGVAVEVGPNETQAVNVTLKPGEEHFFALSVHMLEEAGNEYMGESIVFDITVLAGQLAYEEDSFDNTYDEGAAFPAQSEAVAVPDNATAPIDLATSAMAVKLPADLLNALPDTVETVRLAHTDPKVDATAQTIIFEAADLVDQDGNAIDLEALGNSATYIVTLPVDINVLPNGQTVKIYHDGEQVAEAIVTNGTITYEATHFCEISVTPKVNVTVHYSDGFTKNFDSLAAAMRYGYGGGEQVKIVVKEDITEPMEYLEGNIVCGKEGGVTIKNTIVDAWIYCDSTNFTIGEGVTYDATGYASGLFVYGTDCVINGTVLTDCYYQRYANTKLTINAPGSMTVKTETCIIRYMDGDAEAGIYINGDNNDETVELKLAVAYFYQGMISAKDATLQVGTYWQTNETDNTGSANLVLDNSKLTVTVNEHNFKATGNSTVTLKNGSLLDVAGGIETTNEITVDETSTVQKAR